MTFVKSTGSGRDPAALVTWSPDPRLLAPWSRLEEPGRGEPGERFEDILASPHSPV
jgi:hypothetical protein